MRNHTMVPISFTHPAWSAQMQSPTTSSILFALNNSAPGSLAPHTVNIMPFEADQGYAAHHLRNGAGRAYMTPSLP
jgi:hypothetical protein